MNRLENDITPLNQSTKQESNTWIKLKGLSHARSIYNNTRLQIVAPSKETILVFCGKQRIEATKDMFGDTLAIASPSHANETLLWGSSLGWQLNYRCSDGYGMW